MRVVRRDPTSGRAVGPGKTAAIAALALAVTIPERAEASALGEYFAGFAAPDTRQSVRHFATCTTKRYPAEVQASLRGQLPTSAIASRYPNLIKPACAPRAVFKYKNTRIIDGLFQSDLAEAMLRMDYFGQALPSVANSPPLPKNVVPEFDETKMSEQLRTSFAVIRESTVLDAVAECVSRAAPAAVGALVASEPDSSDEARIFSALKPAMETCSVNTPVAEVPTFAWRATLAMRLYLLVDAARPVSHSGATPNA